MTRQYRTRIAHEDSTSSLRMTPVMGSSTAEPKMRLTVVVKATAMPSLSTIDEWL